MTDPQVQGDSISIGGVSQTAAEEPPSRMRVTETKYTHSPSFPEILARAGCSLLVSTYQAGQLVAIGVNDGRLVFSFHRVDQAMGVAVGSDRIAVGARGQVWEWRDHSELAPRIEPHDTFDRCFLARSATVTGGIQCHEVVWGRPTDETGPTEEAEPQLWVVNTLFSCLAGLHRDYSFVPLWKPPFVTQLAAEDRCHLNGLAMKDGMPAFVTVMATSDEPGGWRASRNDSGAVIHVPSGDQVTTGLSMPHSPRLHDGSLYVLNSGMGRLEQVHPNSGAREVVALMPGYARGLAFHQNLAFVGLSRIREKHIFGGAPIAEYHDELKCGLGVVDITTGKTIATMEFQTGIEEIFDVQVVPNSRCLTLGGTPGDGDEVWLVPPPPWTS